MKPTKAQRKIIKEIKDIYRRKEPLNIMAVKRRLPELIQAVYAAKPFWGWKNALKDAGVNYAKIKVELQEYINCELCGKPMRNLANHVILKHRIEVDEYLMDYPESDLVCEDTRASQLQKETPPIHHWEPVWSREYILDRVAEYHRRGYPMHYSKFRDIDNSLIMAANRYLSGWNEVLIAVGLDPRKLTQEAYRQLHIYPNKEAVIQGIRKRLKKGLRLNRGSVHASKVSLLKSGIEFFGSWDNALKAAGVDPKEVSRRPLKTKKEVLDGIARRQRLRLPLYPDTVRFGHKDSDGVLYGGAMRLFGSWRKAIEAAGLNYDETKKRSRYPTPESVVQEIKRRYRLGLPVNSAKIQKGKHCDAAIQSQGVKYFGSWAKAIEAAGLDYEKILMDRSKYPTPKSVVQEIKRRHETGVPLNLKGIMFGKHREARLCVQACKFFGIWKKAVEAAGIRYCDVALCYCKYPTPEMIIAEIRRRQKKGLSIRCVDIQKGSQADARLYYSAWKYFGQWHRAVKRAGFSYCDMYPRR